MIIDKFSIYITQNQMMVFTTYLLPFHVTPFPLITLKAEKSMIKIKDPALIGKEIA